MTAMKKCKDCQCEFPATVEFFRMADRNTGRLRTDCRNCEKASGKLRWKRDYTLNPDKYKSKVKNCDKTILASYRRNHYQRNAERLRSDAREMYAIKMTDPSYAESRRTARRKYMTKRRLDSTKRLTDAFAARMRHALSGTAYRKGGESWIGIVGYSASTLINHLESLFQPGMTWENYGQWHVDHIRPVSSFEYDSFNHPQFKECWDLSNLQPLWASDNMSKGAR